MIATVRSRFVVRVGGLGESGGILSDLAAEKRSKCRKRESGVGVSVRLHERRTNERLRRKPFMIYQISQIHSDANAGL
jgi:hypothetical protein